MILKRNKSIFAIGLLLLIPVFLAAQNPVPNAGFENWSGGAPAGWYVNNVPGVGTPCTQSGEAHSGSSALRGEVVDAFGSALPPTFWAGSLSNQNIPITQNHTQLTGYYKFSPVGADTFTIGVAVLDANMQNIGGGEVNLTAASSYTMFTLNIEYPAAGTAAYAIITGVINGTSGSGTPNIGSFFLLDEVEMSGTTGIENHASWGMADNFNLKQNYPNPFNPSTNFEFSLPKSSEVQLVVYDQLGRKVATVVNKHLPAGNHTIEWSAGNLSSGVYFYQLQSGKNTATRKFILMR